MKSSLKATKEEVYKYYVEENHTRDDTAKHFNCGVYALDGFCKYHNIVKCIKKPKTKLNASKEEVIEYYINQNHTQEETVRYFNCGIDALYNFLKRNNIEKPRSLVNELESKVKLNIRDNKLNNIDIFKLKELCESPLYSKEDILKILNLTLSELDFLLNKHNLRVSKPKSQEFLNIVSKFSKEDIIKCYIDEGHSQKETRDYLGGIPQDTFLAILDYYNINKFLTYNEVINNISKEEIEKYYIEGNHTRKETIEHFGINEALLYKLMVDYNTLKHERFENLIARISKKDLEDYYINGKHTYIETMEHFNIKTKSIWTFYKLINYYGLPHTFDVNRNSKPNVGFKNLLDTLGISYEQEFYIGRKHYDFKIKNTLIEIDPTYTHNSTNGFKNLTEATPPFYHLEKSKLALDNGYRCIHIFEWEDPEKIINLLLDRDILYARKCTLKEVSLIDAKNYLKEFHLQGYARDQIRLGLYHGNELVSVMTFGKPRYNKNYEWELIRYCSHYNVIGGAEKLFTYFIKNYNPESIISYCDNSKFKGIIYNNLGFKLKDYGTPTKHWHNENTKIHITDNLLRQRGFDQLFKTNYGKGTSNEELMLKNGFVTVYDCGQSKYIWKK